MALVETAELIAYLRLKDELGPGLAKDQQELAATSAAVDRTNTHVGMLGKTAHGAGEAFGHLRMRAGQAAQGLGLVGLAGGAIALTGFIKKSLDTATQWGDTVVKLKAITGSSTDATSRFADAFDKWGISADKQIRIVGFLSKTIATNTDHKKDAIKFEKDYGLSLLDANGHAKDSITVLKDLADVYSNKSIPATERQLLASKLLGRGFTDLIPILSQGRKGIDQAMAGAMSMSNADLASLKSWKAAQRDLADSMGDLQAKVGLTLAPVFRDLFHSISDFVDTHQADIVQWFTDAGRMARQLGQVLSQQVVPMLRDLATGAQNLWNSIPGPLRDLLIKGFVADRAIKFLFGFSIEGVASGLIKDALGGVASQFFGRGSPANPMYVTGGIGGGGGGGGAAGGGSGIGRILGTVGAVTIAAASIYDLAMTFKQFMSDVGDEQRTLQTQADSAASGKSSGQVMQDLAKFTGKLANAQGFDRLLGDTFGGKQELDALQNMSDALGSATDLSGKDTVSAINLLKDSQKQALARGNQKVADAIGADIVKLQNRLNGPLTSTAHNTAKIAAQPTKITVNATTTTTVSTRDVDRAQSTSSRYGFVAS